MQGPALLRGRFCFRSPYEINRSHPLSKVSNILEAIAGIDENQLKAIDEEIAQLDARLMLLRDARKLCIAKLHPDQVKRPGGPGGKRGPRKKTAEVPGTNGAASPVVSRAPSPTAGTPTRPLIETIKTILEVSGEMTLQQIHREVVEISQFSRVSEKGVADAISYAPDSIKLAARGRYVLARA